MTRKIIFNNGFINGTDAQQRQVTRHLNNLFQTFEQTGTAMFDVYVDEDVSVGEASAVYYTDATRRVGKDKVFAEFSDLFLHSDSTKKDKKQERQELNGLSILALMLAQSGYAPTWVALTRTMQECLLESIIQWGRVDVKNKKGHCDLCSCDLSHPLFANNPHDVAGGESICSMCVDEILERIVAGMQDFPDKHDSAIQRLNYFHRTYLQDHPDLMTNLKSLAIWIAEG